MPQAFLGANPGPGIEDALAPVLFSGDATGDVTGTAVEVNFPGRVAVKAVLTAVNTGTSATVDIEVQGADNSDFDDDVVSLGRFAPITEANEGETRILTVHAWKPYMRVVITETGLTDSSIAITVVPADHLTGNARTA